MYNYSMNLVIMDDSEWSPASWPIISPSFLTRPVLWRDPHFLFAFQFWRESFHIQSQLDPPRLFAHYWLEAGRRSHRPSMLYEYVWHCKTPEPNCSRSKVHVYHLYGDPIKCIPSLFKLEVHWSLECLWWQGLCLRYPLQGWNTFRISMLGLMLVADNRLPIYLFPFSRLNSQTELTAAAAMSRKCLV